MASGFTWIIIYNEFTSIISGYVMLNNNALRRKFNYYETCHRWY